MLDDLNENYVTADYLRAGKEYTMNELKKVLQQLEEDNAIMYRDGKIYDVDVS